jgi:N-acetylmuramoyl-L-alanine amidase
MVKLDTTGPYWMKNRFRVAAGLFLALNLVWSSVEAEPRLERVSFWSSSNGEALVIRFHTDGPISAFASPRLIEPGLIEVIVFNTSLSPSFQKDEPSSPVEAYEVVRKGGHLSLQFRIPESIRSPEATVYRDRESDDLLLSISVPDAAPPVAVARAGGETGASGPSRDARDRWKLDTIVIDAGHGGKDFGAVANGVREKDVTLAVALQVGRLIEENLGIRVVYTRKDDRFIELKERGRIANRAGGKLFISIHANAARNRSASGTETFFLGMHKTEAARAVMERENSVVRYEDDPDQYREYDEQNLVLQTLANSAYMRKSEQLAGLIEDVFEKSLSRQSRGVKQAGFYVLWSASMPAVLVELGFVTNAREGAYLKSKEGQANLAQAIFQAVKAFKEQYERDLHLTAGQN